MDKDNLMEYLAAVCDAENAVYACDEAINALMQQEWAYCRLPCPVKPELIEVKEIKNSGKEKPYEIIFIHIFRVVFFFLIYAILLEIQLSMGVDSIISFLGAIVLTFTAGSYLGYLLSHVLFEKPRVNKINKQMKASADEENRQAQENYSNKMQKYNQAIVVENAVFSELDKVISEKKQIRDSLFSELQQLYGMNIIYPTFRNMVAVNQIREYLSMGVCDALEGPDGAYAQYLQDVRTNRICDSITDLKQNLMSALSTLAMTQATLVNELRQTNSNIQEINQSLNHGLSEMQRSLQAAQNATAGQFEAYMQQANSSLEKIEKSTSTAAYNQYIALRQSNVRKYLLKEPQ